MDDYRRATESVVAAVETNGIGRVVFQSSVRAEKCDRAGEIGAHLVSELGIGHVDAVQQLEEISRVAEVRWYARREPVFREAGFTPEVEGREVLVGPDVETIARGTRLLRGYEDLWRGRVARMDALLDPPTD